MIIGAVADIHGNFDALVRAMTRHPEVPFWLCVGDLASRSGAYPEPPKPLYWIKGNNEDFDRVAAWLGGAPQPPNLHLIANGTAVEIELAGARRALRVAGLGGTFAPTWFDTPAAQLPAPKRRAASAARDDKRRHFVRDEVAACKELRQIDILMTHEAPRPFIVVDESRAPARRMDAGKPAINDLLAAMQPRLHLCGHHHRFAETDRAGVRSVCIDRINRSYLLIDAATFAYRKIDQ
jgi:hypothetical protein